jgi:hypothetical protein
MSKEETTNNWRRLQVGLLLAGLASAGFEVGAADTQCPCDISVAVLARNGLPAGQISEATCVDDTGRPEEGLTLQAFSDTHAASIQVRRVGDPTQDRCLVAIRKTGDPQPIYNVLQPITTEQQFTDCLEDVRRTARTLKVQCPE